MKRVDIFSQKAYEFHVLQNETMVIAAYQEIKFSISHCLAVKLWRHEHVDLHINNS